MCENKQIAIPKNLYDAIETRVDGTEFRSVEEYVVFVLEEVLRDDEEMEDTTLSTEDEEEVKKKLRALGYLD